ncbi:Probable E3 ubiquitin-protein ligase hulA (Partial), partial [Seminavis robusta]
IVTTSRIEMQGVNDANPFNNNPLKPGIPVQIMRGRVLEDGLATLNKLGRNLRQRINVQYLNEAGARESGVDAGGLFKEFWTDLCAIAFNPNYALFRVTEDEQNCLYPNPLSGSAHGAETHIVLFEFLGRILGKALYEGITISPQFSHFFLSFLRGDYNYLHMLPDLGSVDKQLYTNLMFLKTYDGDAEDLCLTFSVAVDEFGGNKQIPLIPNGGNKEVTNSNKQHYIGLVAKYYVVDRVKEQSEAFTRGLWDVIDKSWLRLFNEPELQVLISGATGGALDVEDMRAHSRYIGGYTGIETTIRRFWSVVASLNTKQQADLLRFVTSCERPPPLGFASMNPPFTIQRVGIMRDGDLLPTASTCFNTLKLPTYSSEKVMKQRLIYAIEAGAGFELT